MEWPAASSSPKESKQQWLAYSFGRRGCTSCALAGDEVSCGNFDRLSGSRGETRVKTVFQVLKIPLGLRSIPRRRSCANGFFSWMKAR
jgi:hypothetical protein